jgi:uncharacterized coiled-coil DUF342 family protein
MPQLALLPGQREAMLEMVGRSEQRLAEALHATEPVSGAITDETVHALRMLAIDNLIDIVQLRETLQERDAEIASLTRELDEWREIAVNEHSRRLVDNDAAYRREHDIVSALHHQMFENEALVKELSWRRRPWWRRGKYAA